MTLACLIGYFLPQHAFTQDNISSANFLYHFSHANIFHLLVNLLALWQFRPRWGTCFVAYVISSIASCLPFASLSIPTCGLSAFLFACYARNFVAWHRSWYTLALIQFALALIPNVNWRIHLISFFISYLYWYASYSLHRHTN